MTTTPRVGNRFEPGVAVGVWIAAVGLVVAGTVAWMGSRMSYEAVRVRLDALTVDGQAGPFDQAAFGRLVAALRVIGSALLVGGGCMIRTRSRLARAVADGAEAAASQIGACWRAGREAIRSDAASHRWAVLGVLVLGAGLRLAYLAQPMRYDEAFTYLRFAAQPWYVGLTYYEENNHVLHTLLVHVVSGVFGNAPWALRLPALVGGLLILPLAYLTIRLLYGKDAALLTAGWVAVSPPFIEYATNARGHSLLGAAVLAAVVLARAAKRSPGWLVWTGLAFVSAVGFYTLPTMLYFFGAVLLWLALSALVGDARHPRQTLRYLVTTGLAVGGAVLIGYSPILLANGFEAVTRYAAPLPGEVFIPSALRYPLVVWRQWMGDVTGPISLAAMLGCAVAIWRHRELAMDRVPIMVAAVLWCAVVIFAHRVTPLPRHLLSFAPLVVGMASAGLCDLVRRLSGWGVARRGAILATLTLIGSAIAGWRVIDTRSVQTVNRHEHFQDAEAIARFLKGYLREGDAVLAGVPANAPLEYYFLVHGVPRRYLLSERTASQRLLVVAHEPVQQTLAALLEGASVSRTRFDPPMVIQRYPSGALYELRRKG